VPVGTGDVRAPEMPRKKAEDVSRAWEGFGKGMRFRGPITLGREI
jgi:hypothetical protein